MKTLLESTFGANWRTSLSGTGAALFSVLTVLAALPYQLGELSVVIPPEWKPIVFKVSLIAATVLKVWNAIASKDSKVGGTGAPLDPYRAEDGRISPHLVK